MIRIAHELSINKLRYTRSLTDLCILVAAEAAAGNEINLVEIYIAWAVVANVSNSDKSIQVQVSKMNTFWQFGKRFKQEGLDFLDHWREHRKPKVAFNMLPTELRKRLERGWI
jgi:hypothetical protein